MNVTEWQGKWKYNDTKEFFCAAAALTGSLIMGKRAEGVGVSAYNYELLNNLIRKWVIKERSKGKERLNERVWERTNM